MKNYVSLFLTFFLASCSGCSDDGGSAGVIVDAGPDAAIVPGLDYQWARVIGPDGKAGIDGVALSNDGETLVYCTTSSRIGFLDAQTLERSDEIDLHDSSEMLVTAGVCELSIIGEYAYAFMDSSGFGNGPAVIFKIDVATHAVAGVWPVPRSWWTNDLPGVLYKGLQPTKDPNRAVLPLTSNFRRRMTGITLSIVDLNTGEMTDREIVDMGERLSVEAVEFIGGQRLFGFAGFGGDKPGFTYMANSATLKFDWTNTDLDDGPVGRPEHIALDPLNERMLLAFAPSAGWSIRDVATGKLLRHADYLPGDGGFGNQMMWLADGMLLHIASGSVNPWITIQDEESLAPIASVVFPTDGAIWSYALNADRTRFYLGIGSFIAAANIPANTRARR